MDAEKIVEFYKKEMPARGWQAQYGLRSGSTLLAYSKDGKQCWWPLANKTTRPC